MTLIWCCAGIRTDILLRLLVEYRSMMDLGDYIHREYSGFIAVDEQAHQWPKSRGSVHLKAQALNACLVLI